MDYQDEYDAPLQVRPDAMIAAAAHVDREYGPTGYRIGVARYTAYGDGLFQVSHADGSRFHLVADRWGNVRRVDDGQDPGTALLELAREASRV